MRGLRGTLGAVCALMVCLLAAPTSQAAVGYAQTGQIPVTSSVRSLAVDRSDGTLYVDHNVNNGVVDKFTSAGTPGTPASLGPVALGTGNIEGVAVNPLTNNVYAYVNGGSDETRELVTLDADTGGVLSGIDDEALEGVIRSNIGTDASGNVYVTTNKVKKFSPSGDLLLSIDCSSCGALEPSNFSGNLESAVVDSAGNIYVSDRGNDRIIKFGPNGDGPGPAPTLFKSFAGNGNLSNNIVGLDINPATGHIFVSAFPLVSLDPFVLENVVFVLDSSGAQINKVTLNTTTLGPVPIAVDANERIYAFNQGVSTVDVYDPFTLPTVATTGATAVSSSGATLNATVNANGNDTSDCFFEYTNQTDFEANGYDNAQTKACSTLPVESNETAVSATVSGLSPQTTYSYRAVATNEGGTVEGNDEQFTTAIAAPKATTEAASGITQTAATLNAKVDAEGDDAGCLFQYGSTAAYGKTVACSVDPVTGTASTAVTAPLTGLAPASTYHYRVVATNSAGPTNGADKTFVTLADTCQTNAALCPPPTPPASGGGSTPPPPAAGGTPPTTKKPLKCKKGFKKKTIKGKQKCVKKKKKKRK
jgi:hypothetical protein